MRRGDPAAVQFMYNKLTAALKQGNLSEANMRAQLFREYAVHVKVGDNSKLSPPSREDMIAVFGSIQAADHGEGSPRRGGNPQFNVRMYRV